MPLQRLSVAKLRENGHEVIYHDLYAEKFDPILLGKEIPKDAELDPSNRKTLQGNF